MTLLIFSGLNILGEFILIFYFQNIQLMQDMEMKDVYLALRNYSIAKDVDQTFGGLKR